jgi:uncharacterized damage-inducible protein DinB
MEPFVHDAVIDMQLSRDRLETALLKLERADWKRFVPYGSRTLHDILAHLASADHAWALAAKGLLKGEVEASPAAADIRAAREHAIERRRSESPEGLLGEMARRRKLLLSLFDLLEPKHLAQKLASFGEHDSVRERIWVGYHDRLHQSDVERALRTNWYPQALRFLPEVAVVAEALDPETTKYVIYSVDEAWWEKPSPLAGWSYRNLLAHIGSGDWVLQRHLRHALEEGTIAAWPDVDAGNAERVSERRLSTWQALTDEFLSMRHETMVLLAALEPRQLRLAIELPWLPAEQRSKTLVDYLQGFWRHDHYHREQLRNAMRYKTSPRA